MSCIYGLGSPEAYYGLLVSLERGQRIDRDELLRKLVEIQYERNDHEFSRGTFRVRGDIVEVYPSYDDVGLRVGFFGDEIDELVSFDPITGKEVRRHERISVYPKSHFVVPRARTMAALDSIKAELADRLAELESAGRVLEAQRLHQRTMFDLEMIKEIGYCHGIENYSRHLTGRAAGAAAADPARLPPAGRRAHRRREPPDGAADSRACSTGDRSRKQVLVDYGFRLPSAHRQPPAELRGMGGARRPDRPRQRHAGAVRTAAGRRRDRRADHPADGPGRSDDRRPAQCRDRSTTCWPRSGRWPAANERVLVTTLTKRMAEDLAQYYQELGVRVRYLHSDIDTLERVQILRDLRLGTFDVLIGINLLREGLDLPEVSLVAILDADKEGFLRSAGALIQTIGRAARHVNGRAVLYADRMTPSMRQAMDETERRRAVQEAYNVEHGITPASIIKHIDDVLSSVYERDYVTVPTAPDERDQFKTRAELEVFLGTLEREMREAAANLEFERAAALRDRLRRLRNPDRGGSPAGRAAA